MSGDDHGHGSGHGHDDGPSDIIPVGSWQDNLLALISIGALLGLCWYGTGYAEGIKVAESVEISHAAESHAEAAAAANPGQAELSPANSTSAPAREPAPASGATPEKTEAAH